MPQTATLGKHIHKLKRVKYKTGNTVFFCTLDCPFKVSSSLVLGKKTICWRCGESFSMNEYSLRLVKPHCESCHKSKDSKHLHVEVQAIEEQQVKFAPSLSERLNQILHSKSNVTEQEKEEDI